MVAGGLFQGGRAQIIELNPSLAGGCQVADIPVDIDRAVGAMIAGQPTVCGGSYNEDCYVYNSTTDIWDIGMTLPGRRTGSVSVVVSDEEWWIAGGGSQDDPDTLIFNSKVSNKT